MRAPPPASSTEFAVCGHSGSLRLAFLFELACGTAVIDYSPHLISDMRARAMRPLSQSRAPAPSTTPAPPAAIFRRVPSDSLNSSRAEGALDGRCHTGGIPCPSFPNPAAPAPSATTSPRHVFRVLQRVVRLQVLLLVDIFDAFQRFALQRSNDHISALFNAFQCM
jgi:hypothetical protein